MRIRKVTIKRMVKLDVDKENPACIAMVFDWQGGDCLRNFDVTNADDTTRLDWFMKWAGVSSLEKLIGKQIRLITARRLIIGYGSAYENQYISEIAKPVVTSKREVLKLANII